MSRKKMGFWSVWAVGVGGIVGGIFPVLGLAVQMTNGGAPLAFIFAGTVALITTYAYAKLSVAHPCRGGTVTFLKQAFGAGLFSGSLNFLLWLSYVVMLCLYFSAFGSYGIGLFTASIQPFWQHLLTSVAILGTTALNLLNADRIGKAQSWIVGFKLGILILFIAVGIRSIDLHRLEPVTWPSLPSLVSGAMVIFLAYEGFELIANTAEDVSNPVPILPRAYYSAVLFVILLYVLVATVTLGNLPVSQIVAARDYALAQAATAIMGPLGGILVTTAALLSTASASNATLYGSARFSSIITKSRDLPSGIEKDLFNRASIGLFITSGLTLLIANLFDLSRISMMGSAGFLIIFAAVNLANARLYRSTHSQQWISLLGTGICLSALAMLLWQARQTDPQTLWVLLVMLGIAISLEVTHSLLTNRKFHL